MANRIQFRRDTKANWASVNPVLMEGEIGLETDTNHIKIGDGSTAWNSLDYGIGITNITQETGQSSDLVMSQRATTDVLAEKFDKTNVVQTTGTATDKVMSQKAVSDNVAYDNIISNVILNGEGVEFYGNTLDSWVFGDSCFLEKGTGTYRFYKDAGGYFFVSPYIDVTNITKLLFSGHETNNTALAVQYDKDKNILNVIDGTSGKDETDKEIDIVENAKYIRFCADIRSSVGYSIKLASGTYKRRIENKIEEIETDIDAVLAEKFDLNEDNSVKTFTDENPIKIVSMSAGLTSIFHNWGFIGDSLSSGANYDKYGKQIFANYDYSWCQRLIACIGGAKGSNWAVPGFTANAWINKYWNSEAKAEYETNGGDSYFKTDKKQIYCIYLGTNDAGTGVTLGSYDTDVDLDDFNNNANTFIGNYVGIIQRIKSISPSAKIFLITCVPSSSAESGGYNTFIRTLPDKFTNVYLIDLAKYMPRGTKFDDDYIRMGHFSTQGYQYLANCIATYIDYIIRNNPNDFKFVQILNTSYDDGTY